MAVSRILSVRRGGRDDHLSHRISSMPAAFSRSVVRRYPEIGPEFLRGIGGPAVLLLFCLAPHGVFPAISLTRDAVSSYLAFSPLPALFSKNRRYFLCDTFRQRRFRERRPRILLVMLSCGVQHFLLRIIHISSDDLPAIFDEYN